LVSYGSTSPNASPHHFDRHINPPRTPPTWLPPLTSTHPTYPNHPFSNLMRFPSSANQTAGAIAFSNCLGDAVEQSQFASDPDMLTFYGEALMMLTPGMYYYDDLMDGKPSGMYSTAQEAEVVLRNALKLSDNPMAMHLYIHLTEGGMPGSSAAEHPNDDLSATRGAAAATRLELLNISGSGHLEHMPGHLFLRVGRYNEVNYGPCEEGSRRAPPPPLTIPPLPPLPPPQTGSTG
jgi:hypothetical protein